MNSRKIIAGVVFAGVVAASGVAMADDHTDGYVGQPHYGDHYVPKGYGADLWACIAGSCNETQVSDETAIGSHNDESVETTVFDWMHQYDSREVATHGGDVKAKTDQDVRSGAVDIQAITPIATGAQTSVDGGPFFFSAGNEEVSGFSFSPLVNTADSIVMADNNNGIIDVNQKQARTINEFQGARLGGTEVDVRSDILQTVAAKKQLDDRDANVVSNETAYTLPVSVK